APRPRLRPSPGAPRPGWPLCRRACRRALAALAALLLAACGGREGDGPEPAGPGPLVLCAAARPPAAMESAARAHPAHRRQAGPGPLVLFAAASLTESMEAAARA